MTWIMGTIQHFIAWLLCRGPMRKKKKEMDRKNSFIPLSCTKSERGDSKLHTMRITTTETEWANDIQEGIHNAPVPEQHITLRR